MTTRHLGTVTGGRLNLRAAADTSAVVQVQIPDGTLLEVAEYNDTWFATCYGDKAGYCCISAQLFFNREHIA